jgi:hypothetical protein
VTIATAPSSDPEVRAAEPLGDAERDRFVSANADGSVFHLSGWRRAVERAFGHEPRDLVALRAASRSSASHSPSFAPTNRTHHASASLRLRAMPPAMSSSRT